MESATDPTPNGWLTPSLSLWLSGSQDLIRMIGIAITADSAIVAFQRHVVIASSCWRDHALIAHHSLALGLRDAILRKIFLLPRFHQAGIIERMIAHRNELVLVCDLSRIDRRHALGQQRQPRFGLIKYIFWRRDRLQNNRVAAIRIKNSASSVGMLRDAFRVSESEFKLLNLPIDSRIPGRDWWQIVCVELINVRRSKFSH